MARWLGLDKEGGGMGLKSQVRFQGFGMCMRSWMTVEIELLTYTCAHYIGMYEMYTTA